MTEGFSSSASRRGQLEDCHSQQAPKDRGPFVLEDMLPSHAGLVVVCSLRSSCFLKCTLLQAETLRSTWQYLVSEVEAR